MEMAISANAVLIWTVMGFFIGLGFHVAGALVGWPLRRWA